MTFNYTLNQRNRQRTCSTGKTILDAFREHDYLKPKGKKNVAIPQGGSILSPKPPEMQTYYTICRNGARKIPAYYLGGRRVNAHGFGLSQQDIRAINKKSCGGCPRSGCDYSSLQTGCPNREKYSYLYPNCPKSPAKKKVTFPNPVTVYTSPSDYGQLQTEYYLD